MNEELTENQKILLDDAMVKYDRKLKTWALDAALEIAKVSQRLGNHEMPDNVKTVVDAAQALCAYITSTPKEWPVPTKEEADAMVTDMRAKGELPQ